VPDRPLTGPHVGRRTAILGLAATVLVAGCDHGDDIGDPVASGSPSTETPSPDAPDQTPDEGLVDEVTTALNTALGVLAAAHRLRPLRATVAPVLRAHRRHLEVLGGEVEAATGSPLSADAPRLQFVRRSEQRLQATLVDAAGRAESGALAKVLASMSASATQYVATLATEPAR
jgi:hypothetical protein